jgi:ABC-type cobalamin/Fe3+-siderophores transport system ATPase subunit
MIGTRLRIKMSTDVSAAALTFGTSSPSYWCVNHNSKGKSTLEDMACSLEEISAGAVCGSGETTHNASSHEQSSTCKSKFIGAKQKCGRC